jgi:hypothetical protein
MTWTRIHDMRPLWAITEYCCAFFGYIDILPLELFASWATLPLGLLLPLRLLGLLGCFASWATLPLGLLCLLGCFASWAALPLGLLCLLGYSAPWAALPLGLLCPLGCFASWAALPLGLLCPLGCFASWAIYRHFASQAMSHRHCLLWQCRYTDMPLGLCRR